MITTIDGLPPALAASVSPEEHAYVADIQRRGMLPFAVTPHFASLARPEKNDPIRRQFFPDPREAAFDPFALDDPLGENCYRAAPHLIHQYRNRALLLAARTCAGYCRHCFRRVWLTNAEPRPEGLSLFNQTVHEVNLQGPLDYLAEHGEIQEVLISGGDPLTLDNACLDSLFRGLRQVRPGIVLRVCTRMPITEPERFDSETIALLACFYPLKLAVHINHPQELSDPSRTALAVCVQAGIPVYVQTVLLRGINDDPRLLADLFGECLDMGMFPYYLFQMDLARGTAHFRVPLKEGIALYRELGALISGPGLPVYALDLPGGGGKIRLHEKSITGEAHTARGAAYSLQDTGGREWYYPVN